MWSFASVGMVAGLVVSVVVGAAARDGSIFELAGEGSPRVVVTVSAEAPGADAAGGMLGELQGVLAVLNRAEVSKLRACEPKEPAAIGRPEDGETVCFVHVVGREGARVVEVVRGGDGRIVAEEQGTGLERPPRVELNADLFAALSGDWARYRGAFDAAEVVDPRGETLEVPQPYSVGRFVLDKTTLGERFLGGSKPERRAERDLTREVLAARLPPSYDPKRPAGLLVWVSPEQEGSPPAVFCEAADRMGFIIISARETGNMRPPQERYQLALDAVATAERRWHVDPRRIYVAGMSGGGGIASMLAACFPDVYTGAIPICRLSCYKPVPTGVGGGWAAEYRRPPSRLFALFREHPMAAITGDRDFNHDPVTTGAEVMRKDGVNIRVFDYEGMGHEMPTAERFSEALAWVDGAYQEAVKAEDGAAAKALEVYRTRSGAGPLDEGAKRKLLIRVMEAGPWTEPAWEAVDVLRGR